jgi:hypothetical protein
MAHILGIIFNENDKIAILLSIGFEAFSTIFCNFFVPLKDLNVVLKWFSNLSVMKLLFENIVVMIYGFDLCSGDQFSGPLHRLDIEDKTFWWNSGILLTYFLVTRFLTLIILIMKANSFTLRKRSKVTKISNFNNYPNGQFYRQTHL